MSEPTAAKVTQRDFVIDVQEGDVLGYDILRITAYTDSVGTTEKDIWPVAGTIVQPVAPVQLDVVSDDANDTAAGSHAQVIRIIGVDGDYNIIEDDVTLNGLTPVQTLKSFLRVNHAVVIRSGGNDANAGQIDIKDGANIQSVIMPGPAVGSIGDGRAAASHYTVPNNHKFYVLHAIARFSAPSLVIRTFSRTPGLPWISANRVSVTSGESIDDTRGSIVIPPKTDIRFTAVKPSGAANELISLLYWGYLVNYGEGSVPA